VAGLLAPRREDDASGHAQRQAIGALGLLLPLLLWGVAGARSVRGIPGWAPLDSVSAYYHTGAVAIFAGVLAAMAVFLFTYRGYRNDAGHWDRSLGKLAALAATGVALFPTSALPPLTAPLWWSSWMAGVHVTCAVILFGSFVVFSLFLFTRSDSPPEARTPGKRWRNRVYVGCGLGMVAALAVAGASGIRGGPIFWPECTALWLFAVSWLTKGRADFTAGRLLSRVAQSR
jgi:hypothetical protein